MCSTGLVFGGDVSQRVIFTIYMEKAGLCNQLFALMHSLLVAVAMKWDYEFPEFLCAGHSFRIQ